MKTQSTSAAHIIFNQQEKANSRKQRSVSKSPGNSAQILATLLLWAILLPVALPVPALATNVTSLKLESPALGDSAPITPLPGSPNLTNYSSPTVAGVGTRSPLAVINDLLGLNNSGMTDEGGNENAEKEKLTNTESAEKPASKEALLKRVARIETQLTNEKTIALGESFQLDAIPLDKNDAAVDGVAPEWESSNSKVVVVQNNLLAVALSEGAATLTVKAGATKESVNVIVESGKISSKTTAVTVPTASNLMAPTAARVQTSSTPAPEDGTPPHLVKNSSGQTSNLAPGDGDCSPNCGGGGTPPSQPYWAPEVWNSLFRPNNNLGSPAGQTEPSAAPSAAARTRDRAGIGNFSFGIPVASIPGRGIDASIGITYNSQLWNKSTSTTGDLYTYDVNKDWLAPGFDLSLGTLDQLYGSGAVQDQRYSVTAPDGTRHQLVYKDVMRFGVQSFYWESTDGSFYRLYGPTNFNDPIWVQDDQGNLIMYGAPSMEYGRRYTAQIIDRNGNYLSVAYLAGDHKGRIAYIRDTLNRYIRFHYDSNPDVSKKKLIAVTVPAFNGPANSPSTDPSAERQTIRLYYETMNLTAQATPRFSGAISAPSTIDVLRFVYFPSTNMGYRYDYALNQGTTLNTTPVNTAFGMIYKITELRGMQVSTTSTSQIGTITTYGQEAAWTEYNYLSVQNSGNGLLNHPPKYTERTDDWVGRNTASAPTAPKYTYNETPGTRNGEPVKILKVTAPDGTKTETISRDLPTAQADQWNNGLILETSVTNVSSQLMSKSVMSWEQGDDTLGRRSPRISKIDVTNEAGLTRTTVLSYDRFNNPTVVRECDYSQPCDTAGTELRRTETTYENAQDSGWEEVGLLRLPKEIKVYAKEQGAEKLVSRVKYQYDDGGGSALLSRGQAGTVPQHRDESNPSWDPDIYVNGVRVLRYFPQRDTRGNVTQIESFVSPANDNDPDRLISKIWYDMLGNAIKAEVNCCQLKTWEYTSVNHYAYPLSETQGPEPVGSAADKRLTTKAEYNFYTGLVEKTIDENNQQIQYVYDANTLRLLQMNLPNGGQTIAEYHDEQAPSYVKTTTKIDATRSVSAWRWADGRGAVYRTRTQTPDGYLTSDVEFDNMGRAKKTSNPYLATAWNSTTVPAGTKWNEVTSYDAFGRPISVTLTDNSVVQTDFSRTPVTFADQEISQGEITGLATTVTDQAGKKRRTIRDVFGRIVRADEPNASGNLDAADSLRTYYWYDGHGNLRKTSQSGDGATQVRLFKYDGLSRLTHEKQVEATPTLNDTGQKVTSGGTWTGYYKYNSFGKLAFSVDARGATTTFGYDDLYRQETVTYSDETDYQTPKVTFTYGTSAANYSKGRVTKVETESYTNATTGQNTPATSHSYGYNLMGEVTTHTQTIGTANSYALGYDYNLAGGLKSETYPSGRIVTYSVDAGGRLSSVADGQRTYASNFQFWGTGALKNVTLGNGTVESYSFNDRLQLESKTLVKDDTVLQKFVYGYGEINPATGLVANNGKISTVDTYVGGTAAAPAKQNRQQFSYDSLGRLKQAVELNGNNSAQAYQQTFSYDRFGNHYQKAAENQNSALPPAFIESADIDKEKNRFAASTNVIYNDDGSVKVDAKFRNQSYWYDANGRLVKARRNDQTNWQANSIYDALGQRVGEQENGIWTYRVYDINGQLVAEYGLPETEGRGGVSYVHTDAQGSTRAITNSNGWATARHDYAAFGAEIPVGVGQGRSVQAGYTAGSIKQKYGLTERDEITGLDHTDWRKLDSSTGRWTSPDPYKGSISLADPQSLNRYSYVQNDPVNFVDPSGLNASAITFCQTTPDTHWIDENGVLQIKGGQTTCYVMGGGGVGTNIGTRDPFGFDRAGGSGVGQESADDKLPFNSCAEFVEYLVKLAVPVGTDAANRNLRWKALDAAATKLGIQMMHTAVFERKKHIDNGYTGFKDNLVKAGEGTPSGAQGGNVYGHIIANAGAYLNSLGGAPIAFLNNQWDEFENMRGNNKQAPAEIAGNAAGWAVGQHMWNYISGRSPREEQRLRNSLTSELCK